MVSVLETAFFVPLICLKQSKLYALNTVSFGNSKRQLVN